MPHPFTHFVKGAVFDFLSVEIFEVAFSKACAYSPPKKVLDNRYTDTIT